MEQPRGPVIFAGLYAAGILLTILALLMHERFGATEFKAWAPFLQAVLSAGAIFSAWWLQTSRKDADRREAVADTVKMVKAITFQAEWIVSQVLLLRSTNEVHSSHMAYADKGLTSCEDMLRKLNLALLPGTRAEIELFNCILQFGQFGAYAKTRSNEKGLVKLEPVYLTIYRDAYNHRSALLSELGVADSNNRVTPESLRQTGDPPFD